MKHEAMSCCNVNQVELFDFRKGKRDSVYIIERRKQFIFERKCKGLDVAILSNTQNATRELGSYENK